MSRIVGGAARVALAAVAAAGLVLAGSGAASADAGERITRYDVHVAVHADGTAHVRESITYDFGTNARHGIYRKILYSVPAGQDRYQNMDVTGIKVRSPDAPAQAGISDDGTYRLVKVGDPDRTITGVHTYVIDYDTDHVATKAGGGVRYAWNAVGEEWEAPISDVTVRLSGPAAMSTPACYAGTPGSSGTPCDGADAIGSEARFTQRRVDVGNGLTVQADMPSGSVAVAPKYEHVDSDDDFGDEPEASILPSTGTGVTIGVVLLIGAVAYGYARSRRRVLDRRPLLPGLPDRLTPGLAAYLHRGGESAMVMSTLLDLARRGFLRIDDIPGKSKDWMLTRTAPWDPALAPHEQALLRGLFTGRDQISVGRLRNHFRATVSQVTSALEDDAKQRGWAREPYERWIVYGCAAPFFILAFSQMVGRDLNGWPFLLAASALTGIVIAQKVGSLFRFTLIGEDARRQVEEFRRQLADPAGGQRFDPEWALPYAAAFGFTRTWEQRVTAGAGPRFAFYAGASLATFSATAGSSIVSSPSSSGGGSGGGFSGGSVGGGGGGGGGGSW